MRLLASVLLAGLLLSASSGALAQAGTTATSTTTSTTAGSGSGVGAALGVGIAVGAAVAVNALASSVANITTVSFGGRVIAIIPCSGGMLHVTIVPAGAFPVTYIWTPLTVTKLVGPPTHPGQQVLGLASRAPGVCFIGGGFLSSPIPLYGHYMLTVGTSEV